MDNGKILIYNLVFSPAATIQYLIKEKENIYMGIAFLVMALGIIFNRISNAVVSLDRDLINTYLGIGGFIYILSFIGFLILFTAIILFVKNFSLREKTKNPNKNKNYAVLFFKLACFSFMPLLFTPVLSLLGLFFKSINIPALYSLLKMAVYFWIIFLQLMIIKKLFNLKTLTSIALYLLPIIGFFTFIIIAILDLGFFFFSLIQ